MVLNPVSFNEATKIHRHQRIGATLYCSGCAWRSTNKHRTRADQAFREHLIRVWRKARES